MRIGVNLLNFGPGVSPDSLAGWASHVLFDTYTDDAEATRHHGPAWRMLALLAEQVLYLPKGTVR